MAGLIPILTQLDNLAEEIADPNPNRPFENAVGNFARQVCDRVALGRADTGITPQTFGLVGGLCGPYWAGAGIDAPTIRESPVEGGQCIGVLYQVTVFQNRADNGQPAPPFSLGNFRGPISSGQPAQAPPVCTPPALNNRYLFTNGAGVPIYQDNSCSLFLQNPRLVCTALEPEPDGGCGNPPPEITPGENLPLDPGPLPPGTGFSVDIRGNPVLVLPPTLEVSPGFDVEVTPELTAQFGGGGQTPQAPAAAPDQIGEGSGAGGGENDFGDPPDGERWVGCCIQISDRPVGSGVIPQSIPQDVYPTTIGNVHLRFENSSGDKAFDTPVTDRSRNVCVWEPLRGLNPTGVFVNLLPGYSYVVTPYSVPLEQ